MRSLLPGSNLRFGPSDEINNAVKSENMLFPVQTDGMESLQRSPLRFGRSAGLRRALEQMASIVA